MTNERDYNKRTDETVPFFPPGALDQTMVNQTVDLSGTMDLSGQPLTQQMPPLDRTAFYTDDREADAPTMVGGPLAPTYNIAEARGTDEIRPLGPGEYRHFGPGVPGAAAVGAVGAGAAWRGEVPVAEPKRKRRKGGWLLATIVLIVVLAILAWWYKFGAPIKVTAATAHAQTASVTCGQTETIIGTLTTNGDAGTVTYQWTRSDGTQSAQLQQHFAKGEHSANVSLLWTFSGQGTVNATATLNVISPSSTTAATSFTYSCKS